MRRSWSWSGVEWSEIGGNPSETSVRNRKLEGDQKRAKGLDPRRPQSHHPFQNPDEEEGQQLQSFHLHQIHHPPKKRPYLQPPPQGRRPEIVEVEGGHIVRSTGRKDRHSKVCTARGLRDRRVRLSAHTAIQFYDVQDRLGYDRPSKAVDWLIKHAKSAIDELDHLPPWRPTASADPPPPSSGEHPNTPDFGGLDSDAIADTIKSFFPTAATASSSSPSMAYQNYPMAQDLRLSLQSFQLPVFHHSPYHQIPTASAQQTLFSDSAPLPFDATPSNWAEQSQRMAPWNAAETSGGGSGHAFSAAPPPLQPFITHSQLITQRGTLQSSSSPASVRAWTDPIAATQMNAAALHPSSTLANPIGFTPAGVGVFSGFHIPEHDGISDKPTSASSQH